MTQQELCFIAFPIVSLIKSFNNGQKLLGETHLFLEHRKVRYLVGPFGFLEKGDLLIVLSSLPSPLLATLASSAMFNSEFLAALIVELVLLPNSASLAMSNGEFSADLVMVVLSIEVSGLALLKPWMKHPYKLAKLP